MSNYLVIVESPAKAKTIGKYLGKKYSVLASYGHVRDLPAKQGSVDPKNNFQMKYIPIEKNLKHIDKIASSLSKASTLYLATDPDREGEAISWHIVELLKDKQSLKNKTIHRVVFHEITKNAIEEAIKNPRDISMDLVNAQQARRALDYLVGFNLSPLLWKKIKPGLSAGRVQSPALRMIVEREKEIRAFKPQEYWTIESDLIKDGQSFTAKLTIYQGDKLTQFSIKNDEQATSYNEYLTQEAKGQLIVKSVEKKQRKKNPSPPFTTSTLQQEASRKLGFSTHYTMRTAQQLYEGIDIGNGVEGLITYMRTDSITISKDAITQLRNYIKENYGNKNLPSTPIEYKTKSKNAQEAHEAIRPTEPSRTPDSIKNYLTKEQLKLYELIWKRTIASQMIHALIDGVTIEFTCGNNNIFKATGSTIAEPGFMLIYKEDFDDQKDDDSEHKLPVLNKGELIKLEKIRNEQHFTEPPPRFTEASLVKSLEEYGIGRPSTYAPIIYTLQQRKYVVLNKKRFYPTDVGEIVIKFLTSYFEKYVDYDFTAKLEDELDDISRGEKKWVPILETFWEPFIELIQTIEKTVKRSDVTTEKLDELCPKCNKPMLLRLGKNGRFIGCSGYPECDYTKALEETAEESNTEAAPEKFCPKCNSPLKIKSSKYGKFYGCSNYPNCKHIEPLQQPKNTNITCPECNKGEIIQRKSRYGKIFYSCSKYPDCKYALWNEPINEKCPKCKGL